MNDSKKKVSTFTFVKGPNNDVTVLAGGELPDTAEAWALWVMCMRAMLGTSDLPPDSRAIVRKIYDIVSPGINENRHPADHTPLRIVTIYDSAKGEFTAVEFKTGWAGPIQTGWIQTGTYAEVMEKVKDAFGILERVPRMPEDEANVYESWV